MGPTTNQLEDLAYSVSPKPSRREFDMLLSAGERISMSLMSMALQDKGCSAISFTGSQAGVFTCGDHNQARIQKLQPFRVEEELKKNKVVVLAGFQGVNPETKEVTTLGRGGSDTTAVAMAAHFQAKSCQILKDVEGVYTADPRVAPMASPLPKLSYDCLLEMCYWGAKVVHHRAVSLALTQGVPLFIGLSSQTEKGTWVRKELSMYEESQVLSVNSHSRVEHLTVSCSSSAEGFAFFAEFLQSEDLPWPQILASAFEAKQLRLMFTGDEALLRSLMDCTQEQTLCLSLHSHLASVTLTCSGSPRPQLANEAIQLLNVRKIQVHKMIRSPLSLSFLVEPEDRENAIKALHTLVVVN
jgi:aspartate kinase